MNARPSPVQVSTQIIQSPECNERVPTTRAEINRANALFSTGPKSVDGKAKSSLNAVKTALTGRTVLLPTDDAAEYQEYVSGWQEEFQPVGQRESELVQSIADITWRLRRIPGLELAIYAQGRMQFANAFDDHDPALRSSMIELQTLLAYDKQLRNLHIQESRLARRREKEIAELQNLQKERKEKEARALRSTKPNMASNFQTPKSDASPHESLPSRSFTQPPAPPLNRNLHTEPGASAN